MTCTAVSEYPPIMATIDVPFKTPLEVKETIAHLEARFTDRYTEQDAWYRHTVQERHRSVVGQLYLYALYCVHMFAIP